MKTIARTAIAWSVLNWVRKNTERILSWDVNQNPSYCTDLSGATGYESLVCRNKEDAVLVKVEDELFQMHFDGNNVVINF